MSDTQPTASDQVNPLDDPNFKMKQHGEGPGRLQGSLFADDELIIPDAVRTMKKAVSAIHAIPVRPDQAQSLNNRRLFDACILAAMTDCRGKETELLRRLKEDRISPMFEVRVSHLAELAGIPGKNYQRIYAELDTLFETILVWNAVGEDSSIEFEMKSHFFSVLGYGKNYKEGMIRFAFDASVLQLFLEPSIWAKLSLDVMGGLKTSPSYALYQAAWRYCGTHHKVTAALPTHVWVELILGKGKYVREEKDGRKVVQYADFKRRTLTDALARVNACQALQYTLKLVEIYSGNRVAKLQFKFVPKGQGQQELLLDWSKEVTDLLVKIGYSRQEIDDLAQGHSQEEVADALTRLHVSEKRQREQGKAITSRRAYFEGILRNLAAAANGDDLDHDGIEAQVRAAEAQRAADERAEKLRQQFYEHQRNRFADWFANLSEGERDTLVHEFVGSPDLSAGDRIVLNKGVSVSNYGAQALLRKWLATAKGDIFDSALPNPEDRSFESWMAWRLTGGDVLSFN